MKKVSLGYRPGLTFYMWLMATAIILLRRLFGFFSSLIFGYFFVLNSVIPGSDKHVGTR